MITMSGPGVGQELHRRQLLVERIPVLDRKDDVVIPADMQDR
jgi:hypothetical protein